MDAKELLREGDLPGALADLQQQIRSDPSNSSLRIFLFELLSILGDWDRALKQLSVLADLDPSALAIVHIYRDGIMAEQLRKEVFEGKRTPLIFGEPQEWLASLVESRKIDLDREPEALSNALNAVYDAAPEVSGTLNGEAFEWIGDADARLGPVLEAVVESKYYWVPFMRISKLYIEEPQHLREYVWMPAHFVWSNGGESPGLIPTRYVNSELSEESRIQAARATEWHEFSEGMYTGLGQRMIATDSNDYSLMDIREIVINQQPSQ